MASLQEWTTLSGHVPAGVRHLAPRCWLTPSPTPQSRAAGARLGQSDSYASVRECVRRMGAFVWVTGNERVPFWHGWRLLADNRRADTEVALHSDASRRAG